MSARQDLANQIAVDAAAIASGFTAAWVRHMDHRPALPGAASYDADGSRSATDEDGHTLPDHADRTGNLAATGAQAHHDRTTDAVDRALRRMSRDAAFLARFVSSNTPKAPTDKDRREVESSNTIPDPCCELHDRQGSWRLSETAQPSDVKGNLPEPMHLCRWCRDRVLTTGQLPTDGQVKRNIAGQRVHA